MKRSIVLYAATKAFNEYFSEGFSLKHKGKFDVLTVTPWWVKTQLVNRPLGWKTCTAEETIEGS